MAEDNTNTGADENVKGGRWHRFKNKLLSSHRGSDEDVNSSQENDLDAFFRAGRPSLERRRPLEPPLDTSQASKWPALSEVMSLREGEAVTNLPPFQYHKPPRRRGLTVSFLESRPEIIGEGGDESEEPVIAVARRRKTLARVETFPSSLPPQVPPHRQLAAHYDSGGGRKGLHMSKAARPPPYPAEQASGYRRQRAPARSTTLDEQQPLTIQEQRDVRWPSPDRRPQPPHPVVTDEFAQISSSANNISAHAANPSSVPERTRARSDAPMLSISKPDTNVQRPMRQYSWQAISRMRAEEGRTLLTAGEPSATLRPGSSGSESAGSRSSSEENRIPRKRVGSGSATSSRDPSPRFDSRPSTADSLDPTVSQVPQYPPSLSSIPIQAPLLAPSQPQLKARTPRADSPQRSSPTNARGTSLGTALPHREQGSIPTSATHCQPQPHLHSNQKPLDTLRPPNNLISSDPFSRSPSTGVLSGDEPTQSPSPSSNPKTLSFKCTLDAFSMSTLNDRASSNHTFAYLPRWQRVQVFGTSQALDNSDDSQRTGISVLVFDTQSSFTDSVLPLQHFRLDSQRPYTLKILCSPSHMRKLRVRSGCTDERLAQSLKQASEVVRSQEVVQTWDFANTSDMHAFQKAVTGIDVLYDALAHLLLPPRGHDIVSSHKRQYIDGRIQVLGKNKRVCLAAFLEDGQAVLVELPDGAVFSEPQLKGDLLAVRLVDTQLALAAKNSLYDGHSHLPCSMEQIAGHNTDEKDDVTIGFDDEASKAAFEAVLLTVGKALHV